MSDMIGEKFPTRDGNWLTVVEDLGYIKKGGHRSFVVECTKCSKDKELFTEPILSNITALRKGKIPCGCGNSTRWSKEQHIVLLKRLCKERGYKILKIGEWCGSKTKITLECTKDGYIWDTATINSLKSGKGCHECSKNRPNKGRSPLPVEVLQDRLKNNTLVSDTYSFSFSHRIEYDFYWKVTCSSCSVDEYVRNGVCDGTFLARHSSVTKGHKPCRCETYGFSWTKLQREYQINKELKEIGGKFVDWIDGYTTGKSKFKWLCINGHEAITIVSAFINDGHRCKTCNEGYGNGYYPLRKMEEDFLYILDLGETLKLGRSFNVKSRVKNIKNIGNLPEKPKVLYQFTGTHEDVYHVEQKHLKLLRDGGFSYPLDWTNEGFKEEYINTLLELLSLEESIDMV